jgi:ketosteroid isomerase-like protein
MADDREKLIRSIYERWNRNDGDLALDLFDPEVEIHQMASMIDSAGTFHGHDGLMRSAEELSAFKDITWTPERWTDRGDWLVVALRIAGVGDLSGIELDTEIAHAWRIQGSLVTEFCVYETEKRALEAVAG